MKRKLLISFCVLMFGSAWLTCGIVARNTNNDVLAILFLIPVGVALLVAVVGIIIGWVEWLRS